MDNVSRRACPATDAIEQDNIVQPRQLYQELKAGAFYLASEVVVDNVSTQATVADDCFGFGEAVTITGTGTASPAAANPTPVQPVAPARQPVPLAIKPVAPSRARLEEERAAKRKSFFNDAVNAVDELLRKNKARSDREAEFQTLQRKYGDVYEPGDWVGIVAKANERLDPSARFQYSAAAQPANPTPAPAAQQQAQTPAAQAAVARSAPAAQQQQPADASPKANAVAVSADQLAALKAKAATAAKKIAESDLCFPDSVLQPLASLFEQVDSGGLSAINARLLKWKQKQITFTDLAFVAFVHYRSIQEHNGESPTWRVSKISHTQNGVTPMDKATVGLAFAYLCNLGFCEVVAEHNHSARKCRTYKVTSPLYDQFCRP